jgi:hypothetical protein
MTITRLWQAGAEFNNALVEFTSRTSSNFQTSSTKARTGIYSFRTSFHYNASRVLDAATDQLRVGLFVNHNGVASGDTPNLLKLMNGSTTVVDVRFDGTNLKLYIGASEQDSALSSEFAQTDSWLHVGIDVNIAASGGWVYVYLDGVEVLSFDGDTTTGASSINQFTLGGTVNNQFWADHIYFDDLYIDDTSGESTPALVPDYRFVPLTPNGNGFHDTWVGNDGNSTDNYLLVDEIPPDNDTTYVESAIAGEEDSYAMSNLALEDGYEVAAVIGMTIAKKLNSGGALELRVTHRTQVGGSPTFDSGSAFSLTTDYGLLWRRSATRPDAGAWDETTVNALEIGVLTE